MVRRFILIAAAAAFVTGSFSPVSYADPYAVRQTLLFGSFDDDADKTACINDRVALLRLVLDEQNYLKDGKIADFKKQRQDSKQSLDYRADCGPFEVDAAQPDGVSHGLDGRQALSVPSP